MKRKFDLTPIPSEDSVFAEEEEDVFPELVMEEVQVVELPLPTDGAWGRIGRKVLCLSPVGWFSFCVVICLLSQWVFKCQLLLLTNMIC